MNQNGSGGADGNRTRVQNTYLLKLFLRNRLIFTESVLVKRWVHSNRSPVTFGNVKVYTLQSSTTYFLGKQENHRMRHHLFLRLKQETIIQYSSSKLTEWQVFTGILNSSRGSLRENGYKSRMECHNSIVVYFCLPRKVVAYLRNFSFQYPVETISAPYRRLFLLHFLTRNPLRKAAKFKHFNTQ
jgi:hypothetical protein